MSDETVRSATRGDTVKVQCRVDSAAEPGKAPSETFKLKFKIGEGRVIEGLEKAVIGMEPGQTKTAPIPTREAFGERNPDLVFPVPKSRLSGDLEFDVGQRIDVTFSDGKARTATVTDVTEQGIVVDANHPLAGADLLLIVELVGFGG